MLIVCPSCATSYMVEPTSLGSAGRMVRCARCRMTWFVGSPGEHGTDVSNFVNDVIAEAEVEPGHSSDPAMPDHDTGMANDFGRADEPSYGEQTWAAEEPADQAGLVPENDERPPEQFEPPTIADAPPLAPPVEDARLPDIARAEPEAEDIETFAARRKRLQAKRKQSRRMSRWTAVILVLFAFNVALVGARSEVVRYFPQTASLFAAIGLPVNLRHLTFENVRIAKEMQNGVTILLIEGKVVSTGKRAVDVPRLRFAARNAAGQEIYSWTAKPERSVLGPNESLDFRSHLASPPADASDVIVRFFTARDAVAKK